MQGQRVAHYEIVGLLGRGGMGEVWEAVDLNLDRRPVALKFVAADLAADPHSMARFEREAVSAARLHHPNIATIYVFHREGPRPFIAMEMLAGVTLRERMHRGPMAVADALVVGRQIAEALAHAHRRGVIHRDIKPENLMFDEDGTVKVTDFGLARAVQQSRLTMSGTTLGTAGYMAPETLRGEPGAPADVFALGVVMFELIGGAPPFAGENAMARMFTIANDPPRRLGEIRPGVSPAVEALLARMLDKDPASRPDAEAVAHELAALTAGAPAPRNAVTEEVEAERLLRRPTAARAVPGPEVTEAPTVPIPGRGESGPAGAGPMVGERRDLVRPARPRSRRATVAVLGGLLALVAGGVAVAWMAIVPGLHAQARREAVELNNRGFERLVAGDLEGAREAFERALERDGSYAEAKLNLGQVLRREGDRDRAARLFGEVQRAAGPGPLAAKALYNLAEIDLDVQAWAAAVRSLERAAALDTTIAAYSGNLVFALIRAGRHPEAVAAGERGLARWPGDPGLSKNVGYALVMSGRPAEAMPHLDRAVALLDPPGPAYGVRALAAAALGRSAEAREDWRLYLESSPPESERLLFERELAVRGVVP
jgi:tetratricopeptide (TPR) repeat protein